MSNLSTYPCVEEGITLYTTIYPYVWKRELPSIPAIYPYVEEGITLYTTGIDNAMMCGE